jgi:hypothetical protein
MPIIAPWLRPVESDTESIIIFKKKRVFQTNMEP